MEQAPVIEIVRQHWGDAWRKRIMSDHYATTGRQTKAKDYERDIANAEARAIERIVTDLRNAGYTIAD